MAPASAARPGCGPAWVPRCGKLKDRSSSAADEQIAEALQVVLMTGRPWSSVQRLRRPVDGFRSGGPDMTPVWPAKKCIYDRLVDADYYVLGDHQLLASWRKAGPKREAVRSSGDHCTINSDANGWRDAPLAGLGRAVAMGTYASAQMDYVVPSVHPHRNG